MSFSTLTIIHTEGARRRVWSTKLIRSTDRICSAGTIGAAVHEAASVDTVFTISAVRRRGTLKGRAANAVLASHSWAAIIGRGADVYARTVEANPARPALIVELAAIVAVSARALYTYLVISAFGGVHAVIGSGRHTRASEVALEPVRTR